MLQQQGQSEEAREHLEIVHAQDPDYREVARLLGGA